VAARTVAKIVESLPKIETPLENLACLKLMKHTVTIFVFLRFTIFRLKLECLQHNKIMLKNETIKFMSKKWKKYPYYEVGLTPYHFLSIL
jgi:hypothetical protein